MNEQTFLGSLEELFETEPGSLTLTQTLASTGKWDSLNFVSFLAFAYSKYGIRVAPADLRGCQTVQDLFKLVQPK